MNVTINPELRDLLPAPSDESRKKLKENILLNGIQDAPTAYCPDHGPDAVLLDGHTRFSIWCEIAEPPMDPNDPNKLNTFFSEQGGTIDHTVITLADAQQWIVDRQIGRRNCTKEEMEYLRGLDYELAKQAHGGDRKSAESSGQNDHLKTAEKMAKKHNVSEKKIRRDAEFKKDIDAVEAVVPGTKAAVLSGEKKVTAKALKEAAKAKSEAQARAVLDKTKHMTDAEVNEAIGGNEPRFAVAKFDYALTAEASVQYERHVGEEAAKEKTLKDIKKSLRHIGKVFTVEVTEQPEPALEFSPYTAKDGRTKVRATVSFDLDVDVKGDAIPEAARDRWKGEIGAALERCPVVNPRMIKGSRKLMQRANMGFHFDIKRAEADAQAKQEAIA